jgi:hypothetical protein
MLPGATKISRMYLSGPDLEWYDYYIECKKRGTDTPYLSMNEVIEYLDGDTSIVITAKDYRTDYAILELSTLLDLRDLWLEEGKRSPA